MSGQRLSDIYRIVIRTLLCSRKYYDGGGSGGFSKGKYHIAYDRHAAEQLDRYDWRKYADGPPGHQDECMEEKPFAYPGFFYISRIQYRRMSDADRCSSAFDGILQRSSVLLEPASVSYHAV